MSIFCKNCGLDNNNDAIVCDNCSKQLGETQDVINKLYQRLNSMDAKFQAESQSIRKAISQLKAKETVPAEKIRLKPIETFKAEIKREEVKPIPVVITEKRVENRVVKPIVKRVETLVVIAPKTPSKLELRIKELVSPFNAGLELLISVYTKYKTERKLPIFFMTIAGIIAILFGAGFLMQLSFSKLGIYQGVVKIGSGFAFAVASILVGSRLSKKDGAFKEYAAALISLGVILNYLMIYFLADLGNFPILSNAIFGFSLIFLNTIVSIYFSLKYEAKLISVISLIGGAFTPFYLGEFMDGNLYFLYLWFLAVGTSYVAKKINWKSLNYIVFVVSFGTIEYMVFNHNPSILTYAIYFHLFAYTFFFLSLFDGLKLKTSLEKVDIIILSGNLSFFLYNLYTLYDDSLVLLGVIYGANALVFLIILALQWKVLNKSIKIVLFSISSMLIAFAIPSVFGQGLMGLFWSIEAVLLIILGFQFSFPLVRKEGYLLLVISCVKLAMSSLLIVNLWGETLWHIGLVNYFALGIIFMAIWIVGRKYRAQFVDFEIALNNFIQEIVPVWLASVYFMIGYHLVGDWIFNLSIIPLFGFIYWKKQFETKLTDILGLAHLFLFFLGLFLSIAKTGSIHFSHQKLYAQLILVELMVVLWGLKFFYQKVKMENETTFAISKSLRVAFFALIPLLFINLVRKHYFPFIEIGLWVGTLMTYFLFKKLKYNALKIEFYVLTLASFLICCAALDSLGILSGAIFIILIVVLEKAIAYTQLQTSVFKSYIKLLPFVLVILIGTFIFSFGEDNISLSLSVSALLLFGMVYFYDKIGPVFDSKNLMFKIAGIINLLGLLSLVIYQSSVPLVISIVNVIIFSIILKNKKEWFVRKGSSWSVFMLLNQIQHVIIYLFILFMFGVNLEGPMTSILLTLHAIVLLFVAMKNQINILNKLSIVLFVIALIKVIFHDISDFSLVQKIIVLIILGLILLGASYGYVRLSKHFDKDAKIESDDEIIE
jgi:hypothetical protein